MRRLLLLLQGFLLTSHVCAQQYPVSEIPAIFRDAPTVQREKQMDLRIESEKEARLEVTEVRTVLNEDGEGDFHAFYGPFIEFEFHEGQIFDAEGKSIAKIKGKDLTHANMVSDFSIYEDSRVAWYGVENIRPPYTVSYSYALKYHSLLHMPSWFPIRENVAVMSSTIRIHNPNDTEFRYCHIRGKEIETGTGKGKEELEFRLSPLNALGNAFEPDEFGVLFAPNEFEVEGYSGDMSSWNSFGDWIGSLNAGRCDLPAELTAWAQELKSTYSDPLDRARKVYARLQGSKRYVSVQLGIGGWQPFSTAFVESNGYGDCKALSNYVVCLLREAGVPALYMLIRSGADAKPLIREFPSAAQFNHAIVCLPLEGDTLFLECTSMTNPFGYAGSHISGHTGLVITDKGGSLVTLPSMQPGDNRREALIRTTIGEDGDAVLFDSLSLSGYFFERYRPLWDADARQQERAFRKISGYGEVQLSKLHYYDPAGEPACSRKAEGEITGYARASASRLFPELFPGRHISDQLPEPEDLGSEANDPPLYFRDSVVQDLPSDYQPEYLPESVSGREGILRFEITVRRDGATMIASRKVWFDLSGEAEIDEESYAGVLGALRKAESEKAVWVRQD